jgi:hypothetical protein
MGKAFKFFSLVDYKMSEPLQLSETQKIEIFDDIVYHGKTPVLDGKVLPIKGECLVYIKTINATRYEDVFGQLTPRKIPLKPADILLSDERLVISGKVSAFGKLTAFTDRSIIDDIRLGTPDLDKDIISLYFNAQRASGVVYTSLNIIKKPGLFSKEQVLEIKTHYSKTPKFSANRVIIEDTSLYNIINEKAQRAQSLQPIQPERFINLIRE